MKNSKEHIKLRGLLGLVFAYPEWLVIALILLAQAFLVGSNPLGCASREGCTNQIARPVPYDPGEMMVDARLLPPISSGDRGIHWMGTDHLGRDIAASWLRGFYYSFVLSLTAGLIAVLFGLLFGGMAAFYGSAFPINHWLLELLILFAASFCAFVVYHQVAFFLPQSDSLFMDLLTGPLLVLFIWRMASRVIYKRCIVLRSTFNLDRWVMLLIELLESIPALLIVITILSMSKIDHYLQVAILLGLIGWTTAARFARSEGGRLLHKKYIQDLKKIGVSDWKILWVYMFPIILPSLGVVFSYSIAAFILAESFLSFLGIGLPTEFSSWGRMLSDARRFPQSWWMSLFPVLGIFLLVWTYHRLARRLEKKAI